MNKISKITSMLLLGAMTVFGGEAKDNTVQVAVMSFLPKDENGVVIAEAAEEERPMRIDNIMIDNRLYSKLSYIEPMDMSFKAMTNNAITIFCMEEGQLVRHDLLHNDRFWQEWYNRSFGPDEPPPLRPQPRSPDQGLPPNIAYLVVDCGKFDPEKLLFHSGNKYLFRTMLDAFTVWNNGRVPEVKWYAQIPEVFAELIPSEPWPREDNVFWRYFDKCLQHRGHHPAGEDWNW